MDQDQVQDQDQDQDKDQRRRLAAECSSPWSASPFDTANRSVALYHICSIGMHFVPDTIHQDSRPVPDSATDLAVVARKIPRSI